MNQKTVTLANKALLTIEWGENLSDMVLKMNGEQTGSFNNADEVRQGRSFLLPDQQQVTIVYTEYGLEVWQNGIELVSGGKSGSVAGFGRAVKGLFWVGGAQLVIAPILYFIGSNDEGLAIAIGLIIAGGTLIGLGFWARQTGSKIPFWIAIGLCSLNILVTIASGSASGILITGILIYYLYQGTKSDPPEQVRKKYADPNAPLDSDL